MLICIWPCVHAWSLGWCRVVSATCRGPWGEEPLVVQGVWGTAAPRSNINDAATAAVADDNDHNHDSDRNHDRDDADDNDDGHDIALTSVCLMFEAPTRC